jgi:WD40 repeat protein
MNSDQIVCSDDRNFSILDAREDSIVTRSNPLPSVPLAVFWALGKIIISCDDRRIRIFDDRKLKSPLITTKPATKNGAVALFSTDGSRIICVGCDEGMTLVDTAIDIGQLKRVKYLAESPWVSGAVNVENELCLLTRSGVVHRFENVIEFLSKLGGSQGDDE